MKCEQEKEFKLITSTVIAMNDLTILARLEFVKNIIFDKGGDKNGLPNDNELILANDVLDDVIEVLKKYPRAARLRNPDIT